MSVMPAMFNTKHFIKEIQSRPCLWNCNVKEYNDKDFRQNAWQEIAQIMYQDWAELETKERTPRVRDLQKKWKGLRDYFTREKNKGPKVKTGSGTRKKRKTPFLDMLSFLSIKKKPTASTQNPQSTETMLGTDFEHRPLKVRPVTPTTQPATQEIIERQLDDADRNFLLSILPDMKSMTFAQKFEFRFEVMTLIKNITYNQNNIHYYYSAPGPSTFAHPVPEYKPDMDLDMDSHESVVSSPENIKVIVEESE